MQQHDGLLAALQLDEQTALDAQSIQRANLSSAPVWLHFDRTRPKAESWLREHSGLRLSGLSHGRRSVMSGPFQTEFLALHGVRLAQYMLQYYSKELPSRDVSWCARNFNAMDAEHQLHVFEMIAQYDWDSFVDFVGPALLSSAKSLRFAAERFVYRVPRVTRDRFDVISEAASNCPEDLTDALNALWERSELHR